MWDKTAPRLRRTRTGAELILLLYRAMLLAIWAVVVLGLVASIIEIGGRREGPWLDGAVILALGALATIGFFRRARTKWRRALACPIPDRGLKAWLWRQPGWRLALIVWAFQLTALGLVVVGPAAFISPRAESVPRGVLGGYGHRHGLHGGRSGIGVVRDPATPGRSLVCATFLVAEGGARAMACASSRRARAGRSWPRCARAAHRGLPRCSMTLHPVRDQRLQDPRDDPYRSSSRCRVACSRCTAIWAKRCISS
jgi:hypothetical protein